MDRDREGSRRYGKVVFISGNTILVEFEGNILQNEVGFVLCGDQRLKSEVIRIQGNRAFMQVFESTKGIKIGELVEFSGQMLSVELGPGLLGQIYDGLQNPLVLLAEECGFFLPRGVDIPALDRGKKWYFTPTVEKGARIERGCPVGYVKEGIFNHYLWFRLIWKASLW